MTVDASLELSDLIDRSDELRLVALGEHRREGCSLREALASAWPALGDGWVVGLLASSTDFAVADVPAEDSLRGGHGALPFDDWYTARIFGPDGELRWRKPIGGAAFAVMLTEGREPSGELAKVKSGMPAIAVARRYLVWGSRLRSSTSSPAAGWTRLRAARIGHVDVPIEAVGEGGRVQLVAREYLTGTPGGTVKVYDERFVGFEAARREHGDTA